MTSASAPGVVVPGFTYMRAELDAMVRARNYYRWLLNQFRPYLGAHVVEIGAGIGTFSAALLNEPVVRTLTLVEPAANHVAVLRPRFRDDARVRVVQGYFDEGTLDASADSVVLVNVLEHVASDAALVRAIARSVTANGTLLLFVPALPFLYGTLDREFGHVRRYTRPALRALLHGAGFRHSRIHYVNAAGAAAWFLTGKLLRRRTLAPASVAWYDRWIVPWLLGFERYIAPPFGQSLLAIATR
jgi:SAM-dependent methyltransferase